MFPPLPDEIQEVLISAEHICLRVKELAAALSRDFIGRDVVLVGVLKGSFCFLADLSRAMSIPVAVDFIACSSYGNAAESEGMLSITRDISFDVRGRDLIIVEDIVDTGLTLSELLRFMRTKQPASVRCIVLLDKPSRRKVDVHVDYTGFTIADEFVVGYGLDYAERFRSLPDVCILKREVYS